MDGLMWLITSGDEKPLCSTQVLRDIEKGNIWNQDRSSLKEEGMGLFI